MNDNLIRNLAEEAINNKSIEEIIELANKLFFNKKYFVSFDNFKKYLSATLTSEELIDFFLDSEIGYDAQETKICCYMDVDGKPSSCFIASCDYGDEDWIDSIKSNISNRIVQKISEKITDFISNELNN